MSLLTNFVAQVGTRCHQSAILGYVCASFHDEPVRALLKLLLFLLAVRYLLAPAYSARKVRSNIKLTETEIDELVDEWTPEPLWNESDEAQSSSEDIRILAREASIGPKVRLRDGKWVTNLATCNYYNFSRDQQIIDRAVQTIRQYGVGPCSAPGFYGTFDVHSKLEHDIAAHFGTESAVVYSQSFITISSVIPCFCKRGDIIVADMAVNVAIRQGIHASRSIVLWFKHNSMDDLEAVLAKLIQERRPLTRRFIITEGLFENTGSMIDLHRLLALKTKYKFRLMLDETWSYGALGSTGRGVTEFLQIDAAKIDIIVGSLAGCIASGGGFCTGSSAVVEHQRVNSPAVTYSASLPAFLTVSASESIARLQSAEGIRAVKALRGNTSVLRHQLEQSAWAECSSAPESPVMILILKDQHVRERYLSRSDQELLLQECVNEVLDGHAILVTRLKTLPPMTGLSARDLAKHWQPRPAIKVHATVALSNKELEKAGKAIRQAISMVMKRPKWKQGRLHVVQ